MTDELIAEVRAVLRTEVADVTASPELLATVRRRYHRRRLARRFGITVPVLATAITAAVVLAPGPQPPTRPEATVTAKVPPATAAFVKQQVSAALDGIVGDIAYERGIVTEGDKYSPPGQPALYERWISADAAYFRLLVTLDGKPVGDISYDNDSYLAVDYRTRTYDAQPGMPIPTSVLDAVWTPRRIQVALASEEITVVGPGEQINGKPTIKLHIPTKASSIPMTLWVDATTYLPVRRRWDQDHSASFDIVWLPPTAENIAELTAMPPPPDFRPRG